jgi:hypothetical protein
MKSMASPEHHQEVIGKLQSTFEKTM